MSLVALDRPLPHSRDAEASVLAAVMLDASVLDRLADLGPSAFHCDANQTIFGVMRALHAEGTPVDFLTLKNALTGKGVLDAVGGSAYLATLVDGIPDLSRIEHYAQIVKDMAIRREAIRRGAQVVSEAFDDSGQVDALWDRWANRFLESPAGLHEEAALVGADKLALDGMREFEQRHASGKWITGIPSGFPSLDAYTLGWQLGTPIMVAARTTVGKTALMLNMALHAAREGFEVAYYSIEMNEKQVTGRYLSMLSGVPVTLIRSGRVSESQYDAVTRAAKELAQVKRKLRLNCSPGSTIDAIAAQVRREARNGGLDMVLVDYVQIVPGGRGERRNLVVGDLAWRLLELAKRANVAVVAGAQLNREGGKDEEPQLTHFGESDQLSQHPRTALMIDRPALRGVEMHKDGSACLPCDTVLLLRKNSEGETGRMKVHFDGSRQKFEEIPWGQAKGCKFCDDARQGA